MLNKRIKSLLVAGLVIFGMTGGVFAEGEKLPTVSTSTISNPAFEDGKRVVELQGGLIIVELTEKENGEYDIVVKWKETIKIIGVKSYYENGSINHSNYFQEWYECNTLEKEGEFYIGKVIGGGNGPSGPLEELVKVEIEFENLAKGNDDEGGDETPEEIIDDTPTGDASIIPMVVTAVISATGLFVLNKKDDEE